MVHDHLPDTRYVSQYIYIYKIKAILVPCECAITDFLQWVMKNFWLTAEYDDVITLQYEYHYIISP